MNGTDASPDLLKRKSSPTKRRDGTLVLNIRNYPPFLLTAVGNAWARVTSADYRATFGVGLAEWRVIAMLNIEPEIPVSRVCDVIRMDKAAVSRALADLNAKNLVEFKVGEVNPRYKTWKLTALGQKMHAELIDRALAHEARLVSGIDPEDLETFLRVMRHMLANLDPAGDVLAGD